MSGSETDELPGLNELQQRELLRQRAARYARGSAAVEEVMETVTFLRWGGRYALALHHLREIRPLRRMTRIPGTSAMVPGVCHYRGEILSLHDLGAWLGAAGTSPRPGWMLVVEQGASRLGLLADEVHGIEKVRPHEVGPVPVTLGARAACFQGVIGGEVLLLQAGQLFSTPAFFRAF